MSWPDRYYGFGSFEKLLAIPLLLVQFQPSTRGHQVLAAFLISASVVLVVSWLAAFWILPPKPHKDIGVFVKDRITQGTEFALCVLFLLELASQAWRYGKRAAALAACALAGAFFLNILFVTLARTARPRQLIGLVLGIIVVGAVAAALSSHLRDRVGQIPIEIETFNPRGHDTSAGARIEFWRTSLAIMRSAPLLGHGTGSITAQFREATGRPTNATNPHNQMLTVGSQLGVLGITMLIAMWVAHPRLFLAPRIAAGMGLTVVAENIVGSLFNSLLFDFRKGGSTCVGIAGGTVLRNEATGRTNPKRYGPLDLATNAKFWIGFA